jgi:hypothetical protein
MRLKHFWTSQLLKSLKRRENTKFAVVFTFMPDAGVVGKKEKGIADGRENGIGKEGIERDWKEGRE